MEIKIDVQNEIGQALKEFYWLRPEAYPRVVAHGLNKTMVTIRAQMKREVERVFDRPTRYTINSTFTVPATTNRLQVEIRLKDTPGKGTPASKFLAAEVYGGNRRLKRFERALQISGILPAGMFAVPAQGLPLDQYGNIPGRTLVSILSYLKAFSEVGYLANRTAKTTKRRTAQYFAISSDAKTTLPLGIYQRQGRGFQMIIAFVRQPRYEKRLRFHEVGERITRKYLPNDIREAAKIYLDQRRPTLDQTFATLLKQVT